MKKILASASFCALAVFLTTGALTQEAGTITKAVGGYSFEDAAKEG